MLRFMIFILSSALTAACQAQLPIAPRERAAITDHAMVLDVRGASVEVLPAVRAQATGTSAGKATKMVASSPASKFSAASHGVVFNHAMQSYGVMTGEITFKMKGTLRAEDSEFPASAYPGLAKLTNPNVYVVTANSPSEYVALFNRLKARTDVEWLEAVVDYSTGLQRAP